MDNSTIRICPIISLLNLRWTDLDRYKEFLSTIPNSSSKAIKDKHAKMIVADIARPTVLEEHEKFEDFPLLTRLPVYYVYKKENRICHSSIQIRLYDSLAVVNMADLE